MKVKYFLTCLMAYPIVVAIDNLYFVCCSQWNFVFSLRALIPPTFMFLCVNFILAGFLFRPIDKFLNKGASFELARLRLRRLPLLSSISVFMIGFSYSAITYQILNYSGQIKPGVLQHIYYFLVLLFSYGGILSVYTYFAVSRFTLRFKEFLFQSQNIQFLPENGKFSRRLFVIYPIVFFCFLFLFVDQAFISKSIDFRKQGYLFMDLVVGLLAIVIIHIMVTREITNSVQTLLKSFRRVREGDFSLRLPVSAHDEFGILITDFNNMIQGLSERDLIRDAFGKYMTKEIAEHIMDKNINLRGEVRLASILFTDIENYSGLSENMSPEEVVSMLNEYFTVIIDVIRANKGIVNKFIGDSAFAIFNAPVNDPDHAKNAVRSAIQIQQALQNKTFLRNIKINTRIGVNSGVIVFGNIGSTDRMEYTAIGDEVNIASRLEQMNKNYGTKILVGENTHELTKNDFVFSKIGNLEIKGRGRRIDVYKPQF